jgi:pSer/pThr/pTyr-binding forkhead associated (FHA) protein
VAPIRLIVLDGAATKPRYDLAGPAILIGRAPDCDIVVNDQEASRHHARIARVGGRYTIEDAQAANPTILNGRILTEARPLHDGDVILIGSVMLQVNLDSEVDAEPETESGVALAPAPPAQAEGEGRRTRARPDRPSTRVATGEAPAARPGSSRTRSSPSLRRAEAQKSREATSPHLKRPAVAPVQTPPSSPTHALRDVAGRLASANDRLRQLAPQQSGTRRRERGLGLEQTRARLDTILAHYATLGGQPALERLGALLPDPLNNETNIRELYRLARSAPELATAARLAQQLLALGQDLADVLAGADV